MAPAAAARADRLVCVPNPAQRQVRLDGVDPGHLAQPRLVGVPAGGDHGDAAALRGAFQQLAAQGGQQAAHQPDVAEHRAALHGVDRVGADGMRRPLQLDPRQLAGIADQRLEREAQPGSDRAADVRPLGAQQVEVGAGAQVDHDRRAAELGACRQRVAEPIGAGLGRSVDLDAKHVGQGGGVDDERLEADPGPNEALEGAGQGRHDRCQRDRLQLVQAMAVEREQVRGLRRDLVRRRAGVRRGTPRADQLPVGEEAEREVRVADIGGEELHAPHPTSRFAPSRLRSPVLDSPAIPQHRRTP